jgi:hypothetical protein
MGVSSPSSVLIYRYHDIGHLLAPTRSCKTDHHPHLAHSAWASDLDKVPPRRFYEERTAAEILAVMKVCRSSA